MNHSMQSENGPTPSELTSLAVQMYGIEFRKADGEGRLEMLAEACWAWRLAQDVINRGRISERERSEAAERSMRESLETSDAETDSPDNFTLQEAWEALGYKGTRGERSLMDLVASMEAADPKRWEGVRGGLVSWIRVTGTVDASQLRALQEFKSKRAKQARVAGGRARARNGVSNNS